MARKVINLQLTDNISESIDFQDGKRNAHIYLVMRALFHFAKSESTSGDRWGNQRSAATFFVFQLKWWCYHSANIIMVFYPEGVMTQDTVLKYFPGIDLLFNTTLWVKVNIDILSF